VRASLTDTTHRGVAEREFRSTASASENRVAPIVESFDQAVARVLGDLVTWVNARGRESGAPIAAAGR
jgi:cholesterol transport system auxiliary component